MDARLIVETRVRRGLGPAHDIKHHEVYFDDLEPETSDREIKEMAVKEIEDYYFKRLQAEPEYGKYWEVLEVYFA